MGRITFYELLKEQQCHAHVQDRLAMARESGIEAVAPMPKAKSLLSELPPHLCLVSRKRKCHSDRLRSLFLLHPMKSFILNQHYSRVCIHETAGIWNLQFDGFGQIHMHVPTPPQSRCRTFLSLVPMSSLVPWAGGPYTTIPGLRQLLICV